MITELKITNFRSLREVWLDNLQPVNLLIGPNNSGKSNILKALKFFSEFLGGNMPDEEQLSPLFFNLKQHENHHLESSPIGFLFFAQLQNETLPIGFGAIALFHHRNSNNELKNIPPFSIIYAKGKTELEQLSISNIKQLDDNFDDFVANYYNSPYPKIIDSNNVFEDQGIDPDQVSFDQHRNPIYFGEQYIKLNGRRISRSISSEPKNDYFQTEGQIQIFGQFQDLKIYRPESSKLLELYPIQNERSVQEDAGNLVAFLQTMRNEYEGIYNTIKDDLQRFVPEFKSINFKIIDNPPKELQEKYINKSLAKIGLTDKFGRIFWADSLSEGTLYFLSLLCIIHQPEPPKLLLLEEPEKGIHPRRIRETMDLIFELAAEKNIQVILTTHSTAVVDTFADIPEAVYIVERVAQQTTVKNLQRDVIEPHNEQFKAAGEEPIRFTDALGEHWAMGFLGGVPE